MWAKLFLTLALLWPLSAQAQDNVPAHAVPLGEGPGVIGWGSVGPCTFGQTVIWANNTSDPSCGTPGAISNITLGSTTVTGGSNNQILYQGSGFVQEITTGNNGVLVTNGSGVPSVSTTLPSALTVPAPNLTGTWQIAGTNVTYSGSTQELGTVSGALTSGDCLKADASGNIVDSGSSGCGSSTVTPVSQTFTSPGAVSTLTLTATPLPNDTKLITYVMFDGIVQARNTWAINVGTGVITFNANIPTNVQIVEVDWYAPNALGGVGSITVGATSLSGAIVLASDGTLTLSTAGQTINEVLNLAHANTWSAAISLTNTTQLNFQSSGAATDAIIYEDGSNNLNIRAGSTNQVKLTDKTGATTYASLGAVNFVNTNTYFGSGRPWTDILSGANGCAAADPSGVADSTAAIQCQLNYMNSTYAGGIVYVPPGTYLVSGGGITIKGATQLVGAGSFVSTIQVATDSNVINWDASCQTGSALKNLSIFGYHNSAATTDTIFVFKDCNPLIRDNVAWFGFYALHTQGTDSTIENNFFCGYHRNIYSEGANWYIRDKLDPCGITTLVAFEQNLSIDGIIAENHFIDCDFGGATNSVVINDGGTNEAVTIFTNSVFAAPITVTHGRFTGLVGAEISANISTAAAMNIVGSIGLISVTVSGAGTRSCAGNQFITC